MTSDTTPGSTFGKVVIASLVGTTIKWYDFFFFFFGAAALVFHKLCFPDFDPVVGAILAFAGCDPRWRSSRQQVWTK